jgi:glycine/D-amino acid oxidase-like deaminating enzyme
VTLASAEDDPQLHACRIVIIGGGIIGAATAYYLARRDVGVTVIERLGIACAASGDS